MLVATTTSNGWLPGVNTLIVETGRTLLSAQLYQLRGRGDARTAALDTCRPPGDVAPRSARKRLAASRSSPTWARSAGALDLELRGAGNLLGGEQSGHLEAVGLDLYVKLLEQTILELKGEAPREAPRAMVNLKVDLRIPEDYVPEVHQRMSVYKRASQLRDAAEVERLRREIRDRYGPLPQAVESLLLFAGLRLRLEAGCAAGDLAVALSTASPPTTRLARRAS